MDAGALLTGATAIYNKLSLLHQAARSIHIGEVDGLPAIDFVHSNLTEALQRNVSLALGSVPSARSHPDQAAHLAEASFALRERPP